MKNLVPLFTDSAWRVFDTPDGRTAEYSVSEDGKRAAITTRECFGVGKWICSVPVEGGKSYAFTAACKTAVCESDAYLILTQFSEDGKMPIREHAQDAVRVGEYLRFSDTVEMAENTVRLEIELWIKGWGATGEWEVPTLESGQPIPERRVRVAPVHFKWNAEESRSEEIQFNAYMNAIDTLGERGVDLVVFGECMYGRGLNLDHATRTATIEPKMRRALAEKAKKYGTYIIYNGNERDGDNYYNTAFLFDRQGELVGKYRKTHITVGEYERGVTPGTSFPVFDTDFGKVGILICYDQFFPDTALELTRKGAEIICIPTAGDDHHACMGMAMTSGVYLAVAGMNMENNFGWYPTRVVDPLGRILAHTDKNGEAAYAEIDLSKRVRRHWMSTGPALSCVHDDYRYEINTHCYGEKE